MPVQGVIQSPVLVGRDAFLTQMESRLADAAAGAGRVLLVAGEAGIGKTRLLGSITRRARASGFGVARAAAFPGDVQSLGGLLLDLASDLVSGPEPVLRDLGQSITHGSGRSRLTPVTRIIAAACWSKTSPTCSSPLIPASRC